VFVHHFNLNAPAATLGLRKWARARAFPAPAASPLASSAAAAAATSANRLGNQTKRVRAAHQRLSGAQSTGGAGATSAGPASGLIAEQTLAGRARPAQAQRRAPAASL